MKSYELDFENAKMQNYSYFAFLFEKGSKKFINAGFDRI